MSFWERQSIIFFITLVITVYVFNFTSIPNEVILNHLEYNKNATYQDLEIYLCIFSFICFYFIVALGLSPHKYNKLMGKD